MACSHSAAMAALGRLTSPGSGTQGDLARRKQCSRDQHVDPRLLTGNLRRHPCHVGHPCEFCTAKSPSSLAKPCQGHVRAGFVSCPKMMRAPFAQTFPATSPMAQRAPCQQELHGSRAVFSRRCCDQGNRGFNAAAQTRMVSAGGFWPSKRQLSQHLKYMARARISEFESYMPSTQSGLCWLCPGWKKLARQALITEMSLRLPN